jgi:arginyl-tRNA synthetase
MKSQDGVDIKLWMDKALDMLEESEAIPLGLSRQGITLAPPKVKTHGDFATNAALVLAQQLKMPPRPLAEKIAKQLAEIPHVSSVNVAGPGFINLRFSTEFWQMRLASLLEAGESYGRPQALIPRKINVEYVSANPTGPLHAGHGRVAVVADVIANLLSFMGHKVVREYYINDTGGQIQILAQSVDRRYQELCGLVPADTPLPENCYPGTYVKDVTQALYKEDGEPLAHMPEKARHERMGIFAVQFLMQEIRQTLDRLKIHHEVFTSERTLHTRGCLETSIETLKDKGLVYQGVLEAPMAEKKKGEGKNPPKHPLMLFKSTAFGDDQDRPLKKLDGTWTYFAGDIAYHEDKMLRGFDKLINVWGADHASHVKRLQAALQGLGYPQGVLEVILCQMVNFIKDGAPLRMSKRAGTFVTVDDLLDTVDPDVFRFLMVSRKHDTQFTFDLDQVYEESKDNPVFYIHYAHARACSVMRGARDIFEPKDLEPKALHKADLSLLTEESELALIKKLCLWPDVVRDAASQKEPHRLTSYMYDVACLFHGWWSQGSKDATLRFLQASHLPLSQARLALIQGMVSVLRIAMGILGVDPRSEMH